MAVPVVELETYTAEPEVRRISLPHIRVLRLNSRLAFNCALRHTNRRAPLLKGLSQFVRGFAVSMFLPDQMAMISFYLVRHIMESKYL